MTRSVEVAIAILYRQNQFLMQLRDNIPGILYPGYWGLFGGHIEPGEAPEAALKRELMEEICYSVSAPLKFGTYAEANIIRHVYYAPLTVYLDQLVLNEGWDMGLLTPEQIQQGECYSAKAGQIRPLGLPHQRLMLAFITQFQAGRQPKLENIEELSQPFS